MTGGDKPHVQRLFPPAAPQPVEGCAECREMGQARADLAARQDYSGVSDANVLIRRHRRLVHGLN